MNQEGPARPSKLDAVHCGARFGRLEVQRMSARSEVKQAKRGGTRYYFAVCRCDCGLLCEVRGDRLVYGKGTKSCGCLATEALQREVARTRGRLAYLERKLEERDAARVQLMSRQRELSRQDR